MGKVFKIKEDGIKRTVMQMIAAGQDFRPLWKTRIYPDYQKAQIERWDTEGGSEDLRWRTLNSEYKKKKKTLFKDFHIEG